MMTTFLQCLLCSLIHVAVAPVDFRSLPRGYHSINMSFPELIGKTVEEAKTAILFKLPGVKIIVVFPTSLVWRDMNMNAVLVEASEDKIVTEVHSFFGYEPDLDSVRKLVGIPYWVAVAIILQKIPSIEIIVKDSEGRQLLLKNRTNYDTNHILMTADSFNNVAVEPVYMRVQ